MFPLVFKFVEHPENNEKPMDQKSRVKFKIMSLKVKGPMDYIPELVCRIPLSLQDIAFMEEVQLQTGRMHQIRDCLNFLEAIILC